uniref:NADH dehydrogenase subunit 1 n=1 Tax=Thelohanellus kitauei TaxID=669202 RepID=UPI003002763F
MITIILITFFYLVSVGFLTVLERKIIGIVQNRVSVFKFGVLGFYYFFLDFLKVFLKNFFSKGSKKISSVVFLLFLLILLLIISFNLLIIGISVKNTLNVNFLGLFIIIYLTLDSFIFILKIFFICTFKSKYVGISTQRLKLVYLFLEGIFIFTSLLFLVLGEFSSNFCYIIFVLFILGLLKSFRTPFDYMESESETVSGVLLELQGVGFLLGSLLEYGVIINNLFFIVFLLNLGFISGLFYLIFFIFITSFLRALVVRVRIQTLFYIIYQFWVFFTIVVFIIIVIFIF